MCGLAPFVSSTGQNLNSLSPTEMTQLSKTLPWDHPAARDLDFTVHKKHMQGKKNVFCFVPLHPSLSPLFYIFYRHVLDSHFYWDPYCHWKLKAHPRKMHFRIGWSLLLGPVLSLEIKSWSAQNAFSLSKMFLFSWLVKIFLFGNPVKAVYWGTSRPIRLLTFFRRCRSTPWHTSFVFIVDRPHVDCPTATHFRMVDKTSRCLSFFIVFSQYF